MESKGKQDCKESSVTPERETIQEPEVNVILPTSGSDNPELSTEALTRLVREVLEGVFKARIRDTSETLQARSWIIGRRDIIVFRGWSLDLQGVLGRI
ncbi:hypothetical protein J1N35_007736 [Gossypium stocksii]|uniref:Uncharacterized protein n=1 Tax=Gossypium stocksii TaxID=47602 RepID=A0A9D4AFU9_9ROSI|nr:hypothetical protein J1N35_007736 [Gossypium stocksii]